MMWQNVHQREDRLRDLDVGKLLEISILLSIFLLSCIYFVSVVTSRGEAPCFVCMQFCPTLSTSVVTLRVDCNYI